MLSSTRVARSCLFFSVSVISCTSLSSPTLMAGVGSVEEMVGLGGTDAVAAAGGGTTAEEMIAVLVGAGAEAPVAEAEGAPTFPTAEMN